MRAQGRGRRDGAARAQEGEFLAAGLALDQRERDVAAEQRAALAREAVAEARRDRADAGDRHDAERDAGDEDAEAAQPAAQFAQREAQRQRDAGAASRTVSAAMLMKRSVVGCAVDAAGAQAHHAVAALRQRGDRG